ncbi:hypothetical protein J6590_031317 [Homalodisca vitripennis]|nr:hypothetical protein J6590_031317 [Homalodisca vitripennis]
MIVTAIHVQTNKIIQWPRLKVGSIELLQPVVTFSIAKCQSPHSLTHKRPWLTTLHLFYDENSWFLSLFRIVPGSFLITNYDVNHSTSTAEARVFAKELKFKQVKDLHEIALELSHMPKLRPQQRIVVLTQGCDPVIVAKDGVTKEYPVIQLSPEKVIDTTGAGDAFVGEGGTQNGGDSHNLRRRGGSLSDAPRVGTSRQSPSWCGRVHRELLRSKRSFVAMNQLSWINANSKRGFKFLLVIQYRTASLLCCG